MSSNFLANPNQIAMSGHYRTLKFGDRTFSYDAGIDSLPHHGESSLLSISSKRSGESENPPDDGIGSSDDETPMGSTRDEIEDDEMPSGALKSIFGDVDDDHEIQKPEPPRKKIIIPDESVINKLLAFDEEEEDDSETSTDDEEDEDDFNDSIIGRRKKNSSQTQTGWHKTICKDLANYSSSSSSSLNRRHSISICESQKKKWKIRQESESNPAGLSSRGSSIRGSSRSSTASTSPRNSRVERNSFQLSARHMMSMQYNVQHRPDDDDDEESSESLEESMQTLDLRLDEVIHIRSVLTKAELEALPLDGNVKENVEKGKMCFICMKTKFGLFTRGHQCEMCKQWVCYKCHTEMKIPLEHFTKTPVYTLRPSTSVQTSKESAKNFDHHVVNKKLPLKSENSVGSAPNSPQMTKKSVTTISGQHVKDCSGPVSLPPNAIQNKYATLPIKSRRMSWISPRESERQKLEGSLLTICTGCKGMVLKVIRASKTTRKPQMVTSRLSLVRHTEQRV